MFVMNPTIPKLLSERPRFAVKSSNIVSSLILNVWLRSTMFYDNAINRLNGKKRRPHYTKKKYP